MSLVDQFDSWVFDLDGTMYVGSAPVDGAADLVASVQARNCNVLFVTNDPTRTATRLRERLARLGVDVAADQILHAGRSVALHAAECGIGRVLVLGTPDLASTLEAAGLTTELTDSHHGRAEAVDVDAIVVGLNPNMVVEDLDVLLRNWHVGMPIFSANADRTYPGQHGPSLGSGAVAQAVAFALGVEVTSCGKPSSILFAEAEYLLGDGSIVMLGDSLEADIAGAQAAGWTAIWFNRAGAELPPDVAPDYVVTDLRTLLD